MSHPDLDYYDLMTLDELDAAARNIDPMARGEWTIRRAVRDAMLDLAEALDEEDLVLVPAVLADSIRQTLAVYNGDFLRDADHG